MVVCFISYVRCLTQRGPETHLCISEFDHRWLRWWLVVCSKPCHYVSHTDALTIRPWGTSLSKILIKIQQLFWNHIHEYFSDCIHTLGIFAYRFCSNNINWGRYENRSCLLRTASTRLDGMTRTVIGNRRCRKSQLWKQMAFHIMWLVFYLISH